MRLRWTRHKNNRFTVLSCSCALLALKMNNKSKLRKTLRQLIPIIPSVWFQECGVGVGQRAKPQKTISPTRTRLFKGKNAASWRCPWATPALLESHCSGPWHRGINDPPPPRDRLHSAIANTEKSEAKTPEGAVRHWARSMIHSKHWDTERNKTGHRHWPIDDHKQKRQVADISWTRARGLTGGPTRTGCSPRRDRYHLPFGWLHNRWSRGRADSASTVHQTWRLLERHAVHVHMGVNFGVSRRLWCIVERASVLKQELLTFELLFSPYAYTRQTASQDTMLDHFPWATSVS